MTGSLWGSDTLLVRFRPLHAPGCAGGSGWCRVVRSSASKTASQATRSLRIADAKPAGRQVEGGCHGWKADSDHQISLSISVDLQAIVAHAARAGAGSGDRLPRSEALHLSPGQG